MKNLYFSVSEFDKFASENFGLESKILMENAASKIEQIVRKKLKKGAKILTLLGGGNNAADGICALRKLTGDFKCVGYFVLDKQNQMCEFQQKIAKNLGVKFRQEMPKFGKFDLIIDAIFGSGFKGEISPKIAEILRVANEAKALKIAVDVPSGLRENGSVAREIFKADFTITMGARKICLYSDLAKDFVGRVKLANLGLSEKNFTHENTKILENFQNFKAESCQNFLLEKSDMILPNRKRTNTNKGDFGHVFVSCGDMSGAAEIAGLAANAMGAGLVSLVSARELKISPLLMQKTSLKSAKIVVIGCGLGASEINFNELTNKQCVIDADMFYKNELLNLLENNAKMVLTPHPKEFSSLLKICGFGEISVSEIQANRFELARNFSLKFPQILVLKGANTIITQNGKLFIMPFGSAKLAKSGSGDALCGIIAALIAQNFTLLQSAISGTIAHALSLEKCRKNAFAINSFDIIEGVKWLRKK